MPSRTTLEKLGITPNSLEGGDAAQLVDGRWRIDSQLGYGAFGKVYRATDVNTGEALAIKIFKEDFKGGGDLQELGLMFDCDHPNIVRINSFGYTSGRKYIVYELVQGGSLRDFLIRYPRVPVSTALGILRETVNGLEFAHARGVLHRDLKPENILLTEPDWPFGCKLCDFGLSTRFEPGERLRSTFGSPAYMAPEQFRKNYDHRVDFYALGVIFYEMLFGRRPFSGDASSISHAHEHLEIELPETGPSSVVSLLRKMLAKDPDDRYTSAEDLLADIRDRHAEVLRENVRTTLPVPRRPQLSADEAWQAMIRGGIDQAVHTVDGGLLFEASGNLCTLRTDGELQKVTSTGGADRLLDGGSSRTTLGWLDRQTAYFVRGNAIIDWELPQQVCEGAYDCMIDRSGKYVVIATPTAVFFYRISGEALWKATIETYGVLPCVTFTKNNLLWLTTEAPRTQLICLTTAGDQVARTASPCKDVEILGADDDSVIVLCRGAQKLVRMDGSGFVESEQPLSEPPMSLERVAENLVASVSVSHIELFEASGLKPRGLLEHPYPEEPAIFCRSGLYQLAELPEGTRIRHTIIKDV
jgi:serine/threonine-protein kinase